MPIPSAVTMPLELRDGAQSPSSYGCNVRRRGKRLSPMRIAYRCMQWLGRVMVVIGLLNCAAFFVIAVWIGGVAVNRKSATGHYQLAAGGRHTWYIEVSRDEWTYSR